MNLLSYSGREVSLVLADWNSHESGLTRGEAAERLEKYGPNKISSRQAGGVGILVRQFRSPLVYLLIFAAALDLWFGEKGDAAMIGIIVLANTFLGFFQEYKSEKTLKFLKKYLSRTVRVRRDGGTTQVDAADVVPGDVVELAPGSIIPADMRFLECEDLWVNEAALTGESVSVQKGARLMPAAAEHIHEAVNLGFSGTSVEKGRGVGVVVATGENTLWGELAQETVELRRESSFEKDLAKFGAFILRLVAITLAAVFAANILIKGGQANWGELVIFAIALAVSVIPEALPVVITFSLTRGAMRLAAKKAVVKRLSALEDLGGVEILCTDKTGTLTEGHMELAAVYGARVEVLEAAAKISISQVKQNLSLDAFDSAIWKALPKPAKEQLLNSFRVVKEVPFDPEKRLAGCLVAGHTGTQALVRGALEQVLDKCQLDKTQARKAVEWAGRRGREGQRILAVAQDQTFCGMMAFRDPVKATSKRAVKDAAALGVRMVILTGDSPEVAGAVAVEIGLIKDQRLVIGGDELEKMDAGDQHAAVEKYSVFARMTPTLKNRVVDLLQERYRVGFLGEGINDGPALKSADVGLVVDRASDIAREAADIILLKKDLEVIVSGIREGRMVAANLGKYLTATLSSNLGNFFAVATASLLTDFLPMLPVQILLLNLLSDLPMVAIATDNVEAGEIAKPKTLGLRQLVGLAAVLGIVSTVFDFVFFGLFYRQGAATLQTGWFVGSVLTELVFLFSVRTGKVFFRGRAPSATLVGFSLLAALATILIPLSDWGRAMFRFSPLGGSRMLVILGVVGLYFLASESAKLAYNRNFAKK